MRMPLAKRSPDIFPLLPKLTSSSNHKPLLILFKGVWNHLENKRRLQLYLLLALMLLTGLAELVSLGAVLPFLTVLSSPELIWESSLAQPIIDFLGFTSLIGYCSQVFYLQLQFVGRRHTPCKSLAE